MFLSGLEIKGFLIFSWWKTLTDEERKPIIDSHSKHLKGDLATKTSKVFKLSQIAEALEYGGAHPLEGKVLL